MNFDVRPRTILLTVAGSRAYGMNTANSDVDVKGVAIPPKRFYIGFLSRWEQADKTSEIQTFFDLLNDPEKEIVSKTKLEGTIYDLRKFIGLAVDCNPNILDVLFCRDEEIRLITPLGALLRDNRDLFISAKAKHTFSGYAIAQLKRIKGHYHWHTAGPKAKPTRTMFGLPEHTLIPADQIATANAQIQKKIDEWNVDYGDLDDAAKIHLQEQISTYLADLAIGSDEKLWAAGRHIGLDENYIQILQQERQYSGAINEWRRYQVWLAERNKDRAKLEANYGYDTKHGAHLVRLLKMGREIMLTGKVNVHRGGIDAEDLINIRNGSWPYEKLIEWAEEQDLELQRIYKEQSYVVPHSPDRNKIDDLCVKMVETAWSGFKD